MTITTPITMLMIPRMAGLCRRRGLLARVSSAILCAAAISHATPCAGAERDLKQPVSVVSPDGRIQIEVALTAGGNGAAAPCYRVTFKGRDVVLNSRLQVDLAGGATLGANCTIEDVRTAEIHSEYGQFPGKRSHVIDHCFEAVISLRERGGKQGHETAGRRWQLVVRAYDDGVALRYRFPKQEGWSSLEIAAERTTFHLPENAIGWMLPLNSFTTSYEKRYERKSINELPGDWLLGLPLLVELPGTGWAAITEADLTEYAGMYLARPTREASVDRGINSATKPDDGPPTSDLRPPHSRVAFRRCRPTRKSRFAPRCRTILPGA